MKNFTDGLKAARKEVHDRWIAHVNIGEDGQAVETAFQDILDDLDRLIAAEGPPEHICMGVFPHRCRCEKGEDHRIGDCGATVVAEEDWLRPF